MSALDEIDRQLIALLRDNARLPVASIAAGLGVSRATAKSRMERLESSGVIKGYTVSLDTNTGEAPVRAIAMIEVAGRGTDRVARTLGGMPQVRALFSTNGRWDLVAEVETQSLFEFDEVLRSIRLIDGVTATETSLLLASRFRR